MLINVIFLAKIAISNHFHIVSNKIQSYHNFFLTFSIFYILFTYANHHFCARFLRITSLCQARADINLACEKFIFHTMSSSINLDRWRALPLPSIYNMSKIGRASCRERV